MNVKEAIKYLELRNFKIIAEDSTMVEMKYHNMAICIDKNDEEFSMRNENGDYYDWYFLNELEDFIY